LLQTMLFYIAEVVKKKLVPYLVLIFTICEDYRNTFSDVFIAFARDGRYSCTHFLLLKTL
jgi:hypothetical protein